MWATRCGQRLSLACNLANKSSILPKFSGLKTPCSFRKFTYSRTFECSATSAAPSTSDSNSQKKSEKKPQNNRRRKAAGEGTLEEIRAGRIAKAEELREAGLNPYAYSFENSVSTAELQEKYAYLEDGEEVSDEDAKMVGVRGRVTARRVFGKLAFCSLQDESGSIQLYIDKQKLNESDPQAFYQMKNLMDVGDIVGARGSIKKTDKGELSINVATFEVLTKSLLPLPDKFHGLQDIEKRYRQRYVDLIVTPGVRDVLRARARITSLIRRKLEAQDFLEMETPVLETCAGGADARPFVTHHNALDRRMTLRIATELHLKRLIVGGFERVFEIGRIFRNEGISTRHNPEFTSVEVYQAYGDMSSMLSLTESLVVDAAREVCGTLEVDYQGMQLDFNPPFRRESMAGLVEQATGVDFKSPSLAGDLEAAKAAAVKVLEEKKCNIGGVAKAPSVGHVLNEVFEEVVESSLLQPTFVLEHPLEISPLAKPHRSVPGSAERFELFIAGRELANSFSELTDPVDQRARLEAQVATHAALGGGKEGKDDQGYDVDVDEDFLTALEYGMPPTGGMGMGVDRLVMLLTDSASIRDVIAFPVLKSQ